MKISIKQISYVKNDVKEQRFGNFADVISKIVIDKKYVKGLDNFHFPIIYIKPCLPDYDKPMGNMMVPEWTRYLIYR